MPFSSDPLSVSQRHAIEEELKRLPAEQADRRLYLLRGLFQCIGELNQRVGDLEREAATTPRAGSYWIYSN